MTNDPYGFQPKYFQARRDYARLLDAINSIALTAGSQLDAQNDVDLVRADEHRTIEAERHRMQQRLADAQGEYVEAFYDITDLIHNAIIHLDGGRKKKATAELNKALDRASLNLPPF